ncbi:MAG: hypothetical protein OHK0013_01130 [Sandaracinaceae bacterium]
MRNAPSASFALTSSLVAWSLAACGGSTYVQPPPPAQVEAGPLLAVRPLLLVFDRGRAEVSADGTMTFDGTIVGRFAESGSFTTAEGRVWATMDAEGAIHVTVDDPAAVGPTSATFTTAGDRLVRPDGAVLASLDTSGQLVTATGSFPLSGISSRTRRLALFLYLVAATYAEDVPTP